MSTVDPPQAALGCVALHGISEDQYQGLVKALGGNRFRHAYDGWTLDVIGETQPGSPATRPDPSRPAATRDDERAVTLRDISPQQYGDMLAALGDHRLRHSYHKGTLEIMSPSQKHEWENRFLDKLLSFLASVLEIEILSLGSWTIRPQDHATGLEPDSCFYIANEPLVRFKTDIDLESDPPPDLAIEIDVSNSSESRQPIYEALKVPELWRYDGKRMQFLSLSETGYTEVDHSRAFPLLPPTKLEELLDARGEKTELQLVKEFVAWVQRNLT